MKTIGGEPAKKKKKLLALEKKVPQGSVKRPTPTEEEATQPPGVPIFFFVVFLRRRVQLCEFCNYNKIQLLNKRLEHINRCYFTCQSEILFILSLTKLSFRFNNYR